MSDSMRCRSCNFLMLADQIEKGQSCTTSWYRCSQCGKRRMKTAPASLEAQPGLSSEAYRTAHAPRYDKQPSWSP